MRWEAAAERVETELTRQFAGVDHHRSTIALNQLPALRPQDSMFRYSFRMECLRTSLRRRRASYLRNHFRSPASSFSSAVAPAPSTRHCDLTISHSCLLLTTFSSPSVLLTTRFPWNLLVKLIHWDTCAASKLRLERTTMDIRSCRCSDFTLIVRCGRNL